jgi:hypothetical protein
MSPKIELRYGGETGGSKQTHRLNMTNSTFGIAGRMRPRIVFQDASGRFA